MLLPLIVRPRVRRARRVRRIPRKVDALAVRRGIFAAEHAIEALLRNLWHGALVGSMEEPFPLKTMVGEPAEGRRIMSGHLDVPGAGHFISVE